MKFMDPKMDEASWLKFTVVLTEYLGSYMRENRLLKEHVEHCERARKDQKQFLEKLRDYIYEEIGRNAKSAILVKHIIEKLDEELGPRKRSCS